MGNIFIKVSVKGSLLQIEAIEKIQDSSSSLIDYFYDHLDCRRIDSIGLGQDGEVRLITDDEVLDNKCEVPIFQLFDEVDRMPFEIIGDFILCTSTHSNGEPHFTGFESKEKAFSVFKELVLIESVFLMDTETQLRLNAVDISFYKFLLEC